MAEKFIPFHEAIRNQPGRAQHFQPVTPQGAISTMQSPPTAHAHIPAEPRVTLSRDGDRITEIKIQCACGEVIELVVP